MCTKKIENIYLENQVFIDNPESCYLLRLANMYGEELLEEFLEGCYISSLET
ncbi:MAG: ribonucleotide-diphosphate reductase subunit beta [Cyanobacteria bacterium P01_G01_bin.49]